MTVCLYFGCAIFDGCRVAIQNKIMALQYADNLSGF